MAIVEIAGRQLEYELIASADTERPTVVFLHEGLGSVALWKDFPQRFATLTGCPVLVYSRFGYGRSAAARLPRSIGFMHEEATQTLPLLLRHLRIDRPILFGHSDGASIALIHAGEFPQAVAGVIVMAPHLFVEPVCVERIAAVRAGYASGPLPGQLARYHADPDAAFFGWADVWLDPAFLAWNIEPWVARIACPLLAIQGCEDEYGTMAQLDVMQRLQPRTTQLRLPSCRHSPHRDQPDVVLAAAATFIRELAD